MAIDGTLVRLAARYPDLPSSGVGRLANDPRLRYGRRRLTEVVISGVLLALPAAFLIPRLLRREERTR